MVSEEVALFVITSQEHEEAGLNSDLLKQGQGGAFIPGGGGSTLVVRSLNLLQRFRFLLC